MLKITEVGPRDGLQNESTILSTAFKIELIQKLIAAGIQHIEFGSFVSPKWVPQMADTAILATQLPPGAHYSALVPNLKGLDNALQLGVPEIAIFGAASETFSLKNTNVTRAQSLENFQAVTEQAKAAGLKIRAYISCVLGCPFEGHIATSAVVDMAEKLYAMGCYEVSLGDTIGVGTPDKVRTLLKAVQSVVPQSKIAVHFHDTYGQATANIYAALLEGITSIDSAVGGLGGCPYAKGATGNIATEEVVYLLEGLGHKTGVNLPLLVQTGLWLCKTLAIPYRSKVGQALAATF